jgi:hypothetical protein
MKMDSYMRFILTVIALCLVWNVFKPLLIPRKAEAEAYGDILSVNIERVGGNLLRSCYLFNTYT